jgi:benzodiazapine receptor
VFPIVWTSLYAMIAWSGWRVWSAPPLMNRSLAQRLWFSQLSTNSKWSKLFFGQHRLIWRLPIC